MFFGRKSELQELNALYAQKNFICLFYMGGDGLGRQHF